MGKRILYALGISLGLMHVVGCSLPLPPPLTLSANHPDRWHTLPQDSPPAIAPQNLSRWWASWHDEVLSQLIERALAGNLDLRTAQTRIMESRARASLAEAALAPSLHATASARRSAPSAETSFGGTRNILGLGLDARWEADLWGGLGQGLKAAEAELAASQARLYAAQVTLVAEVARVYVDLRSTQQRLGIARDNLTSQAETLQLTAWRAQAGLASQVELEQARASLEQTRAQIPVLERDLAMAKNRLAILLGEAPGALEERLATVAPLPTPSLKIALGIPADTLRQRPDVRAAEFALLAETARLNQAEAARYPSLTLSGTVGLEALSLDGLTGGQALARSILASLTAPLFDAGRLARQVEIQLATRERAGLALEQTVLNALEEVERALIQLAQGQARVEALRESARAARAAATLAQQRYASGLVDFLTVLTSERNRLTQEDALASAQADVLQALIQLYKALGGGWSPTPIAQGTPHE